MSGVFLVRARVCVCLWLGCRRCSVRLAWSVGLFRHNHCRWTHFSTHERDGSTFTDRLEGGFSAVRGEVASFTVVFVTAFLCCVFFFCILNFLCVFFCVVCHPGAI